MKLNSYLLKSVALTLVLTFSVTSTIAYGDSSVIAESFKNNFTTVGVRRLANGPGAFLDLDLPTIARGELRLKVPRESLRIDHEASDAKSELRTNQPNAIGKTIRKGLLLGAAPATVALLGYWGGFTETGAILALSIAAFYGLNAILSEILFKLTPSEYELKQVGDDYVEIVGFDGQPSEPMSVDAAIKQIYTNYIGNKRRITIYIPNHTNLTARSILSDYRQDFEKMGIDFTRLDIRPAGQLSFRRAVKRILIVAFMGGIVGLLVHASGFNNWARVQLLTWLTKDGAGETNFGYLHWAERELDDLQDRISEGDRSALTIDALGRHLFIDSLLLDRRNVLEIIRRYKLKAATKHMVRYLNRFNTVQVYSHPKGELYEIIKLLIELDARETVPDLIQFLKGIDPDNAKPLYDITQKAIHDLSQDPSENPSRQTSGQPRSELRTNNGKRAKKIKVDWDRLLVISPFDYPNNWVSLYSSMWRNYVRGAEELDEQESAIVQRSLDLLKTELLKVQINQPNDARVSKAIELIERLDPLNAIKKVTGAFPSDKEVLKRSWRTAIGFIAGSSNQDFKHPVIYLSDELFDYLKTLGLRSLDERDRLLSYFLFDEIIHLTDQKMKRPEIEVLEKRIFGESAAKAFMTGHRKALLTYSMQLQKLKRAEEPDIIRNEIIRLTKRGVSKETLIRILLKRAEMPEYFKWKGSYYPYNQTLSLAGVLQLFITSLVSALAIFSIINFTLLLYANSFNPQLITLALKLTLSSGSTWHWAIGVSVGSSMILSIQQLQWRLSYYQWSEFIERALKLVELVRKQEPSLINERWLNHNEQAHDQILTYRIKVFSFLKNGFSNLNAFFAFLFISSLVWSWTLLGVFRFPIVGLGGVFAALFLVKSIVRFSLFLVNGIKFLKLTKQNEKAKKLSDQKPDVQSETNNRSELRSRPTDVSAASPEAPGELQAGPRQKFGLSSEQLEILRQLWEFAKSLMENEKDKNAPDFEKLGARFLVSLKATIAAEQLLEYYKVLQIAYGSQKKIELGGFLHFLLSFVEPKRKVVDPIDAILISAASQIRNMITRRDLFRFTGLLLANHVADNPFLRSITALGKMANAGIDYDFQMIQSELWRFHHHEVDDFVTAVGEREILGQNPDELASNRYLIFNSAFRNLFHGSLMNTDAFTKIARENETRLRMLWYTAGAEAERLWPAEEKLGKQYREAARRAFEKNDEIIRAKGLLPHDFTNLDQSYEEQFKTQVPYRHYGVVSQPASDQSALRDHIFERMLIDEAKREGSFLAPVSDNIRFIAPAVQRNARLANALKPDDANEIYNLIINGGDDTYLEELIEKINSGRVEFENEESSPKIHELKQKVRKLHLIRDKFLRIERQLNGFEQPYVSNKDHAFYRQWQSLDKIDAEIKRLDEDLSLLRLQFVDDIRNALREEPSLSLVNGQSDPSMTARADRTAARLAPQPKQSLSPFGSRAELRAENISDGFTHREGLRKDMLSQALHLANAEDLDRAVKSFVFGNAILDSLRTETALNDDQTQKWWDELINLGSVFTSKHGNKAGQSELPEEVGTIMDEFDERVINFFMDAQSPLKEEDGWKVSHTDNRRVTMRLIGWLLTRGPDFDWVQAEHDGRLPLMAKRELGELSQMGDISIGLVKNYSYMWHPLGVADGGWHGVIESAKVIPSGYFEMTVKFTKDTQTKRRTFQIGRFVRHVRHRDPASNLPRETVLDISDRLGLRALKELVTKPADFNWEKAKRERKLPVVDGLRLGTTHNGAVTFRIGRNFPYQLRVGGRDFSDWDAVIVNSDVRNNIYHFTVEFTKPGEESIRKKFQIGSLQRKIYGARDERGKTKDVLAVSSNLGRKILSHMVTRPSDFDWAAAKNKGFLPPLAGYQLGATDASGKINFNPSRSFMYPFSVLGFGEPGREAVVIREEAHKNFYEFTVELTKDGKKPVQKTFQIGRYKRLILGENEEKGKSIEMLDIDDRLGLQAITELVLKPKDFDWQEAAKRNLLPDTEGLRLGFTDKNGSISFSPIKDYFFSWLILGKSEQGWEAIVIRSEVNNGVLEFEVELTKKGEDPVRRIFQIGSEVQPLYKVHKESPDRQMLAISDRLGIKALPPMITKPMGFDWQKAFEAGELPALKGLSLGETNAFGSVSFSPFPEYSYRLRVLNSRESGWRVAVKDFFVDEGFPILILEARKNSNRLFRIYEIGKETKQISPTFRRKKTWPKRDVLKIAFISPALTEAEFEDFHKNKFPNRSELRLSPAGSSTAPQQNRTDFVSAPRLRPTAPSTFRHSAPTVPRAELRYESSGVQELAGSQSGVSERSRHSSKKSVGRTPATVDAYIKNALEYGRNSPIIQSAPAFRNSKRFLDWYIKNRKNFVLSNGQTKFLDASYIAFVLAQVGKISKGRLELFQLNARAHRRALTSQAVITAEIRRIWENSPPYYPTDLARLKAEFDPDKLPDIRKGKRRRPMGRSYRNIVLSFAYYLYGKKLIAELNQAAQLPKDDEWLEKVLSGEYEFTEAAFRAVYDELAKLKNPPHVVVLARAMNRHKNQAIRWAKKLGLPLDHRKFYQTGIGYWVAGLTNQVPEAYDAASRRDYRGQLVVNLGDNEIAGLEDSLENPDRSVYLSFSQVNKRERINPRDLRVEFRPSYSAHAFEPPHAARHLIMTKGKYRVKRATNFDRLHDIRMLKALYGIDFNLLPANRQKRSSPGYLIEALSVFAAYREFVVWGWLNDSLRPEKIKEKLEASKAKVPREKPVYNFSKPESEKFKPLVLPDPAEYPAVILDQKDISEKHVKSAADTILGFGVPWEEAVHVLNRVTNRDTRKIRQYLEQQPKGSHIAHGKILEESKPEIVQSKILLLRVLGNLSRQGFVFQYSAQDVVLLDSPKHRLEEIITRLNLPRSELRIEPDLTIPEIDERMKKDGFPELELLWKKFKRLKISLNKIDEAKLERARISHAQTALIANPWLHLLAIGLTGFVGYFYASAQRTALTVLYSVFFFWIDGNLKNLDIKEMIKTSDPAGWMESLFVAAGFTALTYILAVFAKRMFVFSWKTISALDLASMLKRQSYRQWFDQTEEAIRTMERLKALGINDNWDNPNYKVYYQIRGDNVEKIPAGEFEDTENQTIPEFIQKILRDFLGSTEDRQFKPGQYTPNLKEGKKSINQFLNAHKEEVAKNKRGELPVEEGKQLLQALVEHIKPNAAKANQYLQKSIAKIDDWGNLPDGIVEARIWRRDPWFDLTNQKDFFSSASLRGNTWLDKLNRRTKGALGPFNYLHNKSISAIDFRTREGRRVRARIAAAIYKDKDGKEQPILFVDGVEGRIFDAKAKGIQKTIEDYARASGFKSVLYFAYPLNQGPKRLIDYVRKSGKQPELMSIEYADSSQKQYLDVYGYPVEPLEYAFPKGEVIGYVTDLAPQPNRPQISPSKATIAWFKFRKQYFLKAITASLVLVVTGPVAWFTDNASLIPPLLLVFGGMWWFQLKSEKRAIAQKTDGKRSELRAHPRFIEIILAEINENPVAQKMSYSPRAIGKLSKLLEYFPKPNRNLRYFFEEILYNVSIKEGDLVNVLKFLNKLSLDQRKKAEEVIAVVWPASNQEAIRGLSEDKAVRDDLKKDAFNKLLSVQKFMKATRLSRMKISDIARMQRALGITIEDTLEIVTMSPRVLKGLRKPPRPIYAWPAPTMAAFVIGFGVFTVYPLISNIVLFFILMGIIAPGTYLISTRLNIAPGILYYKRLRDYLSKRLREPNRASAIEEKMEKFGINVSEFQKGRVYENKEKGIRIRIHDKKTLKGAIDFLTSSENIGNCISLQHFVSWILPSLLNDDGIVLADIDSKGSGDAYQHRAQMWMIASEEGGEPVLAVNSFEFNNDGAKYFDDLMPEAISVLQDVARRSGFKKIYAGITNYGRDYLDRHFSQGTTRNTIKKIHDTEAGYQYHFDAFRYRWLARDFVFKKSRSLTERTYAIIFGLLELTKGNAAKAKAFFDSARNSRNFWQIPLENNEIRSELRKKSTYEENLRRFLLQYGINPELVRPGISFDVTGNTNAPISYLDGLFSRTGQDWERWNRDHGNDRTHRGVVDMLARGSIHLLDEFRVYFVGNRKPGRKPKDWLVVHEILHDIFLDSLNAGQRREFLGLVQQAMIEIEDRVGSHNDFHDLPEHLTMNSQWLKGPKTWDLDAILSNPDELINLSEIFARIGGHLLGYTVNRDIGADFQLPIFQPFFDKIKIKAMPSDFLVSIGYLLSPPALPILKRSESVHSEKSRRSELRTQKADKRSELRSFRPAFLFFLAGLISASCIRLEREMILEKVLEPPPVNVPVSPKVSPEDLVWELVEKTANKLANVEAKKNRKEYADLVREGSVPEDIQRKVLKQIFLYLDYALHYQVPGTSRHWLLFDHLEYLLAMDKENSLYAVSPQILLSEFSEVLLLGQGLPEKKELKIAILDLLDYLWRYRKDQQARDTIRISLDDPDPEVSAIAARYLEEEPDDHPPPVTTNRSELRSYAVMGISAGVIGVGALWALYRHRIKSKLNTLSEQQLRIKVLLSRAEILPYNFSSFILSARDPEIQPVEEARSAYFIILAELKKAKSILREMQETKRQLFPEEEEWIGEVEEIIASYEAYLDQIIDEAEQWKATYYFGDFRDGPEPLPVVTKRSELRAAEQPAGTNFEITAQVRNKEGVHARPVMYLAEVGRHAAEHGVQIKVRKEQDDRNDWKDAAEEMFLMLLMATEGTNLIFRFEFKTPEEKILAERLAIALHEMIEIRRFGEDGGEFLETAQLIQSVSQIPETNLAVHFGKINKAGGSESKSELRTQTGLDFISAITLGAMVLIFTYLYWLLTRRATFIVRIKLAEAAFKFKQTWTTHWQILKLSILPIWEWNRVSEAREKAAASAPANRKLQWASALWLYSEMMLSGKNGAPAVWTLDQLSERLAFLRKRHEVRARSLLKLNNLLDRYDDKIRYNHDEKSKASQRQRWDTLDVAAKDFETVKDPKFIANVMKVIASHPEVFPGVRWIAGPDQAKIEKDWKLSYEPGKEMPETSGESKTLLSRLQKKLRIIKLKSEYIVRVTAEDFAHMALTKEDIEMYGIVSFIWIASRFLIDPVWYLVIPFITYQIWQYTGDLTKSFVISFIAAGVWGGVVRLALIFLFLKRYPNRNLTVLHAFSWVPYFSSIARVLPLQLLWLKLRNLRPVQNDLSSLVQEEETTRPRSELRKRDDDVELEEKVTVKRAASKRKKKINYGNYDSFGLYRDGLTDEVPSEQLLTLTPAKNGTLIGQFSQLGVGGLPRSLGSDSALVSFKKVPSSNGARKLIAEFRPIGTDIKLEPPHATRILLINGDGKVRVKVVRGANRLHDIRLLKQKGFDYEKLPKYVRKTKTPTSLLEFIALFEEQNAPVRWRWIRFSKEKVLELIEERKTNLKSLQETASVENLPLVPEYLRGQFFSDQELASRLKLLTEHGVPFLPIFWKRIANQRPQKVLESIPELQLIHFVLKQFGIQDENDRNQVLALTKKALLLSVATSQLKFLREAISPHYGKQIPKLSGNGLGEFSRIILIQTKGRAAQLRNFTNTHVSIAARNETLQKQIGDLVDIYVDYLTNKNLNRTLEQLSDLKGNVKQIDLAADVSAFIKLLEDIQAGEKNPIKTSRRGPGVVTNNKTKHRSSEPVTVKFNLFKTQSDAQAAADQLGTKFEVEPYERLDILKEYEAIDLETLADYFREKGQGEVVSYSQILDEALLEVIDSPELLKRAISLLTNRGFIFSYPHSGNAVGIMRVVEKQNSEPIDSKTDRIWRERIAEISREKRQLLENEFNADEAQHEDDFGDDGEFTQKILKTYSIKEKAQKSSGDNHDPLAYDSMAVRIIEIDNQFLEDRMMKTESQIEEAVKEAVMKHLGALVRSQNGQAIEDKIFGHSLILRKVESDDADEITIDFRLLQTIEKAIVHGKVASAYLLAHFDELTANAAVPSNGTRGLKRAILQAANAEAAMPRSELRRIVEKTLGIDSAQIASGQVGYVITGDLFNAPGMTDTLGPALVAVSEIIQRPIIAYYFDSIGKSIIDEANLQLPDNLKIRLAKTESEVRSELRKAGVSSPFVITSASNRGGPRENLLRQIGDVRFVSGVDSLYAALNIEQSVVEAYRSELRLMYSA